ncbi:twin transmembrane helix small protein [Novosphingobium sp. B 225]|uniref:twin transmembrane helix small protein n=1 Tax=Novosphingobium sp. B 225 TaxID=1961849 RepID=UPI000B4A8B4F|nr:twin transmembrane helix small protein [Novosphingobium sp. B 225]
MSTILIPVLIIAMIMVVVSLGRGIAAFMQSTREDLERPDSVGPSEMQLKQNKMMMQRILWQGGAVMLVALLLFANR